MEELCKPPRTARTHRSRYAESRAALPLLREEIKPKPVLLVASINTTLLGELTAVLAEYQPLIAPTWTEAVRIVGTAEVDVVLMDVKSPDWRGLGLLAQIRVLRPELPIVALTGNADIAIAVSAMKLGAFDCVARPARADSLLQILHAAAQSRVAGEGSQPAPALNQRARALLVGGNLPVLTTWRLLLDRGGVDSTIATTSADALHCIAEHALHLLVLDDSLGATDLRSISQLIDHLSGDPIVVFLGDPTNRAALDQRLRNVIVGRISANRQGLSELLRRVDALLSTRLAGARPLPVLGNQVSQLLAYVAAHHTDLALARVAKAVGLSRATINRRFRSELGTTFWRYVTCFRTYLAIEMLSDRNNKLEQVAHRTGFSDAAHLSRILVRHTGRRASFFRRCA